MYQTQASLKKKAQGGKVDRKEFIYHLTAEFYSTMNSGEKCQNLVFVRIYRFEGSDLWWDLTSCQFLAE